MLISRYSRTYCNILYAKFEVIQSMNLLYRDNPIKEASGKNILLHSGFAYNMAFYDAIIFI